MDRGSRVVVISSVILKRVGGKLMRLSTALAPALMAAGLLLAETQPAAAQFAPTPYDPSNAPSVLTQPPAGAEVAPETLPYNPGPYNGNQYNGGPYVEGAPYVGESPQSGYQEVAPEDDGVIGWEDYGDGSVCSRPIIPYFGQGRQYGTGGIANPRWFDISFEYVELSREEISRRVDFMSAGIGGDSALSTNQLDFHDEPGFRVTGAYLLEPGTNVEATYMGTFHFQDRQTINDPQGNLYSAFSDFGTNPGAGVAPAPDPQNPNLNILVPVTPGFTDTDNATFASIVYSSQLNSFELNWRRRWLSPNARVHTSFLAGARWLNITERLRHEITTAPGLRTGMNGQAGYPVTGTTLNPILNPLGGAFAYDVRTSNNLVGFQIGQEIVASINQFFRFGGEVKYGIFGNDMEMTSNIKSGLGGDRFEFVDNADVSFVGEANVYGLLRLASFATMRAGYTVLFVEGISLAPEQIDFSNPFVTGTRGFSFNDNGNAFYHGFNAGLELNW
jgi:hypothetical protein